VHITIDNVLPGAFIFNGTIDNNWLEGENWDAGSPPPYNYKGTIEINANCVVPEDHLVRLGLGGQMSISSGVALEMY